MRFPALPTRGNEISSSADPRKWDFQLCRPEEMRFRLCRPEEMRFSALPTRGNEIFSSADLRICRPEDPPTGGAADLASFLRARTQKRHFLVLREFRSSLCTFSDFARIPIPRSNSPASFDFRDFRDCPPPRARLRDLGPQYFF